MQARLLKQPEVSSLAALPKSSLYKLVQSGQFPKPVKLSTRSVAWRENEVLDWVNSRQAA